MDEDGPNESFAHLFLSTAYEAFMTLLVFGVFWAFCSAPVLMFLAFFMEELIIRTDGSYSPFWMTLWIGSSGLIGAGLLWNWMRDEP